MWESNYWCIEQANRLQLLYIEEDNSLSLQYHTVYKLRYLITIVVQGICRVFQPEGLLYQARPNTMIEVDSPDYLQLSPSYSSPSNLLNDQ